MNILQQFKRITTFIFDMDGVLTDGSLMVLSGDQQVRRMHVKDGLGLQMAIQNGYKVVIISGSNSEGARQRLEGLGLEEIFMGVKDKQQAITEYIERNSLRWEEVLFMGDDLPDIGLLKLVGLPCCPADAVAEVRAIAKYISPIEGGWGCVRDIVEKVLKGNEHWNYSKDIVSK